jgi:energy-coupling factor transport system ATP-binding protein
LDRAILDCQTRMLFSGYGKHWPMSGLDFEAIKDKSPFELSGGQKRRVAIAGVLAMRPSVLVLDEPTAGLDPEGREEILAEISQLHEDAVLLWFW